MSLSVQERNITSKELYAHLHDATLSIQAIASHFNLTSQDVKAILDMDNTQMETKIDSNEFTHLVWDIRDYINDELRSTGSVPAEYSYLKGLKTDYWFLQ